MRVEIDGNINYIPDALSRYPISDPNEDDDLDPRASNLQVAAIRAKETDLILDNLSAHARSSSEYQALKSLVESNSKPKVRTGYLSLFKKIADELSVEGDLVLRGSRIVVPPPAIKEVLSLLHASHQGIERTKRRARQIVYWPGFSSDITNMVENCHECAYFRPSNPAEPMMSNDRPSRPFEMVSADFFTYGGKDYLVYSDRFSGFPLVARFSSSPCASSLIQELRTFFTTMGVPNVFRSDNGTPFASSLTQDFFSHWGVEWRPSSPHNPQSNGHAESNVKNVKYLLAKSGGEWGSNAFMSGLLELRNTPRSDGLSPAQRLFGRPLRSKLPIHWKAFMPEFQISSDEADTKRFRDDALRKAYYDRSTRARKKIPLGQRVLIQDPITRRWEREGVVVDNKTPRRYKLRLPSGRVLVRNQRFLRRGLVHDVHDLIDDEEPADEPDALPPRPIRDRRQIVRFQA
ncbi:uncharacterized protein K02A2.6-like [Tigriopus californicus]|uniref:uncharacterized protein K02A2.6-like n=1 Tax=Tigriopus californicus TaxID=6832 RepID=UPI0027DA77EE|nr:uncharacterized protein K02A2.6-like [Tigriopus californicus]